MGVLAGSFRSPRLIDGVASLRGIRIDDVDDVPADLRGRVVEWWRLIWPRTGGPSVRFDIADSHGRPRVEDHRLVELRVPVSHPRETPRRMWERGLREACRRREIEAVFDSKPRWLALIPLALMAAAPVVVWLELRSGGVVWPRDLSRFDQAMFGLLIAFIVLLFIAVAVPFIGVLTHRTAAHVRMHPGGIEIDHGARASPQFEHREWSELQAIRTGLRTKFTFTDGTAIRIIRTDPRSRMLTILNETLPDGHAHRVSHPWVPFIVWGVAAAAAFAFATAYVSRWDAAGTTLIFVELLLLGALAIGLPRILLALVRHESKSAWSRSKAYRESRGRPPVAMCQVGMAEFTRSLVGAGRRKGW